MLNLQKYSNIISKCQNLSFMFKSAKLQKILENYQIEMQLPVSNIYIMDVKSIDSVQACALCIYRNIEVIMNVYMCKKLSFGYISIINRQLIQRLII